MRPKPPRTTVGTSVKKFESKKTPAAQVDREVERAARLSRPSQEELEFVTALQRGGSAFDATVPLRGFQKKS